MTEERNEPSALGSDELPCAELLAGTVAVVRGRAAIAKLHTRKECFGHVKLGTKMDAGWKSEYAGEFEATSPVHEHETELRLMLEEEYYLASTGRIRLAWLQEYDASLHWERLVLRCSEPALFAKRYTVYAHMRCKGYVVKNGIQFGTDYLLYRGSPDEFHAEYCCLVVDGEIDWRRIKTVARLAQDVRKRLVVCDLHEGKVVEIVIDDAFQKPPDSQVSRKRRNRHQSIADHARKRHKASDHRRDQTAGALITTSKPSVDPNTAEEPDVELPSSGERVTTCLLS